MESTEARLKKCNAAYVKKEDETRQMLIKLLAMTKGK